MPPFCAHSPDFSLTLTHRRGLCGWLTGVGLALAVATGMQAQTAELTPMGTLTPGGSPASAVQIVGTPENPVIIGSFNSGGLAQWTPENGWQVITTQFNGLGDVSADGSKLIAFKNNGPSDPPTTLLDRPTGQPVDVPPYPVPEGHEVIEFTPDLFYGNSSLVGRVYYRPIGSYTGGGSRTFRLDLDTGNYVTLPIVSETGNALGRIQAVSKETGRLVFHTGHIQSPPRIVLLDVDGSQKEVIWNDLSTSEFPIREYCISPNGRWLTCTSRPLGEIPLLNAPTTIQRWEVDSTPVGYRRLGQPYGGSDATSWRNVSAIQNQGAAYGQTYGFPAPGENRFQQTCVWHATEADSPRVELREALEEHYGLSLPNWRFLSVTCISADGRRIIVRGVFNGVTQQALVTLSTPLPEPTEPAQPQLWASTGRADSRTSLDLTYASTALGTSNRQGIRLNNTGDAPLQIMDVEITGEHASEFSYSGLNESGFIAVGEAASLSIHFTPQSPGTKTAVLKFSTNDPLAPEFTVNLAAEGPSPILYFRPLKNADGTSVSFDAAVGRSVEASLLLRNNGNQEAVGLALEIADIDLPGLEIVTPIPETLAVGESLTVTLRFTGTEAGEDEGRITLRYDHPVAQPTSLQLNLKASTPAVLTVKDANGHGLPSGTGVIDFGTVTVTPGSSIVQSYSVQVVSSEFVGLTATIQGADQSSFRLESSQQITFDPDYARQLHAQLVIDNPARLAEPYVVNLTGLGVLIKAPEFYTVPATEANTPDLGYASFRLLGTLPMSYRVIRNGDAGLGTWQTASVANRVNLRLSFPHDGYNDLQIEVKNDFGTVKSPVFRRLSLTLPPVENRFAGVDLDYTLSPAYRTTPGIEFHWFKDGEPLVQDTVVTPSVESRIYFRKPRVSDSGRYSCVLKVSSPYAGPDSLIGSRDIKFLGAPEVVPFSLRPARALEPIQFILRASDDRLMDTSFIVTGLPAGLRVYSGGVVEGQISAKAALKEAREYTVTVRAKNSRGTGSPYQVIWRIEPFQEDVAGTFHGTLSRHGYLDDDRQLGGSVTLTLNNAGTFSGRFLIAGSPVSVKGAYASPPLTGGPTSYDPPLPEGMTVPAPDAPTLIGGEAAPFRANGRTYYFTFGLDGPLLAGSFGSTNVTGYRQEAAPANLVDGKKAGRYHFQLGIEADEEEPSEVALPEGQGFTTLTVNPSGVVSWAGKLPEGTAFTGRSGMAHLQLDGQPESWIIPMHQTIYAKQGSVQGHFAFQAENPVGEALLDWNKTLGKKADRLYPSLPLTVLKGEGSRYQVIKGEPLLGGAFHFDEESNLADGQLRLQSSTLLEDLDLSFTLTTKGKSTLATPAPLSRPSLKLTSSTGLFSLSSRLTQAETADRATSGQALWIPHLEKAAGYFTLPEVPDAEATPPTTSKTAPIRAGLLEVQPMQER
ncbi:Abnormal spindle-like microcephaly-assoc'd, ASPM-SPD-2-Hydin [Prosthecobacter debontii]|uniref:Abnormal spindle-like microcephaly-assoc'd, ASPM-SPD-2-Hydin n=1 Tax=Prosthecobacter debontii TaxID=48467 RepID=A0A1T4Y0E6_9BACT|nr:choice-of-anchor D domain-containing protein [Prosthecobacter debontii]SKA95103.1 Abnormal spindle-like microcephaly-assoc'd, ASPM-SPD-2-Hydin [Prosthecobacter debontii]